MCYDCDRLEFVRKRDGKSGQIDFAKRARLAYRKAVMRKDGAGNPRFGREIRAAWAHGYLVAKRFLGAG
jgi:hypothetical protein